MLVLITFVESVCLEYFSQAVLTDLIPSAFGLLVYNDFTSREIYIYLEIYIDLYLYIGVKKTTSVNPVVCTQLCFY